MNELIYRSAIELGKQIRLKNPLSEEVVGSCLQRIAVVNPKLNAVTQLADKAMDQANQADSALFRGDWGGSGRTHRTLLVGASSFRLVILD